ncbi:hypothetical protein [uncultured Gimesia sp.]|uniref:hypothetical protein n=1 Tax=uncultured Gimesia sp. TaxID=1678688 RepID=UPI0030DC2578
MKKRILHLCIIFVTFLTCLYLTGLALIQFMEVINPFSSAPDPGFYMLLYLTLAVASPIVISIALKREG